MKPKDLNLKKLSREQKESLAMEVLNKCYNPSDDEFAIRMLDMILKRMDDGKINEARLLLEALMESMKMINTNNKTEDND